MTTDKHSSNKKQQIEDLLSPQACWAIKERFGSMWRQAWIAWQFPTGTWMVTQVKHLTADSGLPENSGDMFCFKTLQKPTEREIFEMMAKWSEHPLPPPLNEEQAKKLHEAFPGKVRSKRITVKGGRR